MLGARGFLNLVVQAYSRLAASDQAGSAGQSQLPMMTTPPGLISHGAEVKEGW